MFCKYGANDKYIDVTEIVLNKFKNDDLICFSYGIKNFNKYFDDPYFGVTKNLIINSKDNNTTIIDENDTNEYIYDLDLNIILNNLSKINVAVCYWGLTRSTKYVYISHHKYIYNIFKHHKINYDVYMHSWKTNNNIVWFSNLNTPIDYDEYKLLCPTVYKLDEQDDFLSTITFSDYFDEKLYNAHGNSGTGEWAPQLIKNHLCALESQKRVTNMCLESGKKYNFIVYVRPDVEIFNSFPIKIFNIIEPDEIAIPNYDHWEGYNDTFAVVPFGTCKLYGMRINEIISFRKTNGRIVSEKYVKYILDKYFKKIHFINFRFKIIRPK
jgi:hypothetical protein